MPRKKKTPKKSIQSNYENKQITEKKNVNEKLNGYNESNLTNRIQLHQSEDNSNKIEDCKYIPNKEITKEIIIEEYDNITNIPISIIYDNKKFILTTKYLELRIKNTYRCSLWRRLKGKTTNDYSFCYSSITCRIKKNNERKYYITQDHSKDCQNINNKNNSLETDNNKENISKNLKEEFMNKICEYIKNNNSKSTNLLKAVKGYSMYIFYQYKYNLFFKIEEEKIKNIYYQILNDNYPQNWNIIMEKNIMNIDK